MWTPYQTIVVKRKLKSWNIQRPPRIEQLLLCIERVTHDLIMILSGCLAMVQLTGEPRVKPEHTGENI